MEINRAREILNSERDIEVKHGGRSVWINSINPVTGKAFVVTRDSSEKRYQVPINELVEE